MIYWLFSRYSSDRRRLRRRTSLICPNHTGKAIAAMTVCFLLAFILLITAAHAEEPPRTMYVCTETHPLNVRERPSTHAEITARLERGEAVTVIRVKNGWALLDGVGEAGEGWASLKYLSDEPIEPPEPMGEALFKR